MTISVHIGSHLPSVHFNAVCAAGVKANSFFRFYSQFWRHWRYFRCALDWQRWIASVAKWSHSKTRQPRPHPNPPRYSAPVCYATMTSQVCLQPVTLHGEVVTHWLLLLSLVSEQCLVLLGFVAMQSGCCLAHSAGAEAGVVVVVVVVDGLLGESRATDQIRNRPISKR